MEERPKAETKTRKLIKLLLKITITLICLWYVSGKIDFNKAQAAIETVNWLYLFPALLVFFLSKIISATRLNIYFKNISLHLSQWQNIKLYWLGMFYNLFLPGAITGDAYKVILLTKRNGTSYKKTTAAVLLDRFSGLLSLGLIIATYSCFVIKELWIVILLITGALLALPILYFIVKKVFPDFQTGFWPTFLLGAFVQVAMLICVYFILFAINIHINLNGYVFIFLIAAVASVIPISIGGGLGVREFVIIEGAKYSGLDQHIALILSLLFYFITVACSLIGIIFVFKNPLQQNSVTVK